MKPLHKYNNGTGATLCHECRVIIDEDLTGAIYCDDCKPDMSQRGETILGKWYSLAEIERDEMRADERAGN